MRMDFPYTAKAERQYPLVDIALSKGRKCLAVKALVDSGASFSVFRAEIAEFLGVSIEKGKAFYLEGIGGRILGYLHVLNARVGSKSFRCKIVFSREFTVSFSILGRDNFFEKFLITFDEKKKNIILQ